MKKLFFVSILLLILFEVALVYFIMPMPGSQQWEMAAFSHTLYTWRWLFRALFAAGTLAGVVAAFKTHKWWVLLLFCAFAFIAYLFNAKLSAPKMFKPLLHPKFEYSGKANQVSPYRQVLGVLHQCEAKAYPIQILGYHHLVQDSICDEPILVTFCTVCHTGRVYSAKLDGKKLHFDLVGMDRMNAMFSDRETGSWWQQESGLCVAGKYKGRQLKTMISSQMRLQDWVAIRPLSKVLQPDTAFSKEYEKLDRYEAGKSKGELTKRDAQSWQPKSWVLGIISQDSAAAADWNYVANKKVFTGVFNNQTFVIWLGNSGSSIYSYYLPDDIVKDFHDYKIVENDLLVWPSGELGPNGKLLKYIKIIGGGYQIGMRGIEPALFHKEYWHSWQTFHPQSRKLTP